MIEPRLTSRIPSYHFDFSRSAEESIESSSSEPASSSISEDLSMKPLSSGSSPVAASDSFPEETLSSASISSASSSVPVTIPGNTPLRQRLAAIVQRVITRNSQNQQILEERAKFKKNYDAFVSQIGKGAAPPPPSYYRDGMQILGDKILAPVEKNGSIVSRVDLMTNPNAHFSKSDLKVLKALQSFLLNKIVTAPRPDPMHKNDWWALEHLPCITMDATNRQALIGTAADFKDVLAQNLPLHLLRRQLKTLDQAQAQTSQSLYYSISRDYNDPYYKSRWETACDLEALGPINDTVEVIKNNQADLASLFRKWDLAYIRKETGSSAGKANTIGQVKNDGGDRNRVVVPKKSVQAKYQEEYKDLSSVRQRLETIHDKLFVVTSNTFGKLANETKP